MIDSDGFRLNVGIVLCNSQGQVLWARRIGQNSWQFPQGGINIGETPESAMYRELEEELGLDVKDVELLSVSKSWFKYKLPKRLVRWDEKPICLGQKQKWFLLKLSKTQESKIVFNHTNIPEFDDWRWVSYWYPVRQVVSFKRDVYRRVLLEFSELALCTSNRKFLRSIVIKPIDSLNRERRLKNSKNRKNNGGNCVNHFKKNH
ncbi:MAG: RNA pyrophosphohydrolase [Succinivibrionaceae bacterium]